jgi:hypothetical protein
MSGIANRELRHSVLKMKRLIFVWRLFYTRSVFNGSKRTGTSLRVALLVASLKISRFIIYPVGGFNFRHEMV